MKLFKREKYISKIRGFYDADDLIKVITGVRRSGKSSLMQVIADELRERGISEDHIIYIDLDSRAYKGIRSAKDLENELTHKLTDTSLYYIFIDEIQNVSGFEEVINAFRNEGGCSFFITGSNSYLLSGELSTKLTGRYVAFEIFTLSFDEYEDIKKFYGKPVSSNRMEEMNRYILEGGFPRAIQFENLADKQIYTQSVVKEIFEKDIRRRIKIRNRQAFDVVRNFIINNFGATMSINSLHEALKKNGIDVSRQTVSRYIQILLDAKILYQCSRFDLKSKRALSGEMKYYLSDLSFYFSLNTDNRINYGPVLENILFLYAKSLSYAVSVGRIGNLECDFILRDREMNYSYVQVAMTILSSQKTEDREYRPLEMIKDNYAKYIMTTDTFLQKRNGVHHLNLVDFMAEKKIF